jgi:hypothetical protein
MYTTMMVADQGQRGGERGMGYLKSSAAARALGVPYYRLFELIRSGKLPPPPKDTSGDYVWSEQDIEAARRALMARQPRPAVGAGAVASLPVAEPCRHGPPDGAEGEAP